MPDPNLNVPSTLTDVPVPPVAISVHAAVPIAALGTLPVDTFHQVPELHRIHFFFSGHVEVGAFEYRVQREIGTETDVLAEWGNDLLHGGDQLIAVAEVIQHDDAPARLAHADHFIDDFAIVGHGGDDVRRHHCVKAIVGEFHFPGVHQHQPNMV